ncbi:MAG: hypothetical protein H2174_05740 [Vampirovibrio sp.]|nr:hypothetical protein [Vampirovibrio sp.]
MPQQRDYFEQSLFRRVGIESLLLYLETTSHPLLDEAREIIKQSDATGEVIQSSALQTIIEYLQSETKNDRFTDDQLAFKTINELAYNDAYPSMVKECERYPNIAHLPSLYPTAEGLALYLFCKHLDVFKGILTCYQITQTTGWKLFQGTGISTCKPWHQVQQAFKDAIVDNFRKFDNASGNQVIVEPYDSEDKLMLHIWYQGSPKTVEELTDEAKLIPRLYYPSKDTPLIYYKTTGLLKIKTPYNKETLAKAICQNFASIVLVNPNSLLNAKSSRIVNLSELKYRRQFSNSNLNNSIVLDAKVTKIKFKTHTNSKKTFEIGDADSIFQTLEQHQHDLNLVEIMQASIQFKYMDNNKTKTTTIDFTEKTNRITTNSSELGEAIDVCCKSWGLLGG